MPRPAEATIRVVRADYQAHDDAQAIVALITELAGDISGPAEFGSRAQATVVAELARRSYASTLLAKVADTAVGCAVCYELFSTFMAQPVMYIHDLVVASNWRRRGVGEALLTEIESYARRQACCKITLEVLTGNVGAQKLYVRHGFDTVPHDGDLGTTLHWERHLT